jgi:hypothetical protein
MSYPLKFQSIAASHDQASRIDAHTPLNHQIFQPSTAELNRCYNVSPMTREENAKESKPYTEIAQYDPPSKILGVGGFGVVYRVRKRNGDGKDLDYAMKTMSKTAILRRSSGLASVMTELKCLSILSESVHICRLHFAFQDEQRLYLALELAEVGDIRQCLRRMPSSKFPEETAQFYVAQALQALEYCHIHSVLHRGR